MNDKEKLAGFRALIKDHQNSGSYFEEVDGDWREWSDLSPQSKLHYLAGDAAVYDVPFERFAEAAGGLLPPAALADAALRMVLHYERELRQLGQLLPDDGRTESTPLADRFKEILASDPDRTASEKDNGHDIER